MARQMKCFRLSDDSLRRMYYLSGRLDCTNTAIVEKAIRFYYDSYISDVKGEGILPFYNYDLF